MGNGRWKRNFLLKTKDFAAPPESFEDWQFCTQILIT
jgi:hypothetical protein